MPKFLSTRSQFGRAWKLTITNVDAEVISFGSDAWIPEPLLIEFDTVQTIMQGYWTCDISIYNLNSRTEQSIIKQGMTVKLEAGYQAQPYGTIFQGTLFQPLWTRENGTDLKLTLRCVCGLIESSNNFIGQTFAGGMTQRQIVAEMAKHARYPLDYSDIDTLDSTKQSRASTYFGQLNDFLQPIADDNDANLWFSNMALHIRKFAVTDTLPTITYSVDNGLVDTPQQTQDGVVMTVLLDPRLVLRTQVKLDQSVVIQQLARNIPSYPTILDQTGTYLVGRIRHYGNSRSSTWFSEITGFVNAASLLALQTGW